MITSMIPVINHFVAGLPSLVAVIVVLVASWYLLRITSPFGDDDDLVDRANTANGVACGAFLFGVGFALTGALVTRDPNAPLMASVAEVLTEGILIVGLVRGSIDVNNRLVLYRFCFVKEIQADRNLGVAFCLAGSCIASGMIINGAMIGFSQGFWLGLRDIIIYWSVGQVGLVIGGFVYQRITRYDIHQLIEYDDNVAVGVGFGSFLVSIGLIMRAAIVGSGQLAMSTELTRTVLVSVIGIAALIAIHSICAFLFLPKVDYEEDVEMNRSAAVSVVVACASIAMALMLSATIQR